MEPKVKRNSAEFGRTVVFFDIDGTLVDSGGAGKKAFIQALHHVFSWTDNIDYIQFSGATDLDVLRRIFERNRREFTKSEADCFFDRLPLELASTVREHRVVPLAGVKALLKRLGESSNHIVGLITGNIETCARIKLDAAGIDHNFVLGAFGHEHGDRHEIARLGLQRARKLLPPGEVLGSVYVVGDSPADIAAAHAIGATAVAVATGHPDYDELAAAGADVLLTDLSDTDRVESVLV